MLLHVADSPAQAAHDAAAFVADMARLGVADRGHFTLAVSGGSSPWAMFEVLRGLDVPWNRLHLFQIDERIAPAGHADRNLTGLRETLLDHVPILPAHVHPMPVEAADLDRACGAYQRALEMACGTTPAVLDLVHLGLGDDGHTASWPPGDPVSTVVDADVALSAPYQGRRRMTLTVPAVNRSRQILWLVTGATKAGAVRGMRSGDPTVPASLVRRTPTVALFTDADALRAEETEPL